MMYHLQNLIAIPILFLMIFYDVIARLGSYENCSPCRMNFVCDGIADSLIEQ